MEERWHEDVLPLVEIYCLDCHGDGISEGGLDFDRYPDIASMQADRETWKRVRGNLEHHLMPPKDELQPTAEERALIVAWIDEAVFPVDPAKPDPGRVTLRRLNRTEYENTIQDLLGVRIELKHLLPPDDTGYGFDNIGDVLTLSPAHLERLLETARISLDAATRSQPMPFPSITIEGAKLAGPGDRWNGAQFLVTNSEVSHDFPIRSPGRYRLHVSASGQPGGEHYPNLELRIPDQPVQNLTVEAAFEQPTTRSLDFTLPATGKIRLALAFTNDFCDPAYPDPARRDCNVLIHSVRLEGPLDGPRLPKPESHRRLFPDRADGEDDEAYALRAIANFARRAWRRPLREGEAERFLHFHRLAAAAGEPVEAGIRLALEAVLISPGFLYREEPQPEPDNAEAIHPIDEFTLASRLSYFLWSSMPDERLLALAESGHLRENLDAELERMLASPKANAFLTEFPGQWLQLRNVDGNYLSRRVYPRFDHSVAHDFRRETQLFFAHVMRENRPLTELLDADYSFLNEVLGEHYGVAGVEGKEFRLVSLADTPRRGLLGHGSFHVLTSYPGRTSPVLRGKFVLENLLDTAPPPAPPGIPELETEGHVAGLTLRQQMERHREDPACASCHALLDPIGFGLENFDADGQFRTHDDQGNPIDASGTLIGGTAFAGAGELREALLTRHRDDFLRSVAAKTLTYALGRGVDWYDRPALDEIVARTKAEGTNSHAFLRAIVHSVPFQYRRGDGS